MRRLLHLVLAVVSLLELLPALAWSLVRVGPEDGSGQGVFGRRYDASGGALEAAEFGINSHTTSHSHA